MANRITGRKEGLTFDEVRTYLTQHLDFQAGEESNVVRIYPDFTHPSKGHAFNDQPYIQIRPHLVNEEQIDQLSTLVSTSRVPSLAQVREEWRGPRLGPRIVSTVASSPVEEDQVAPSERT